MSNAVFPVLLEAASRALVAAIVVWSALRLLRVRNARTQKAAWTLTLFGALAMPLLMRWQWLPAADEITAPAASRVLASAESFLNAVVHPSIPALPAEAVAAEIAPVPPPSAWIGSSIADLDAPAKTADAADRSQRDLLPAPLIADAPASLQHESAPPQPPVIAPQTFLSKLRALAWIVYLTVAAVLLLRLFAGLISAIRLWMTAGPVLSPVLADLAPAGTVRWSPRLSSPVNLGSGIVLPPDYGEWSTEKLRVVLAHERAHVRQGDFYLQLLAGLYTALVWFSPLGWWLRRKLSELGEAMGDRAGLEEAASPSSYARMLLEFAALPRPTRTGVAMARTGHLASRIERLLNEPTFRQTFTGSRRRAALALIIAPLVLLASAGLVRVQAAGQTATPALTNGQAQMLPASQQSGVSNPPAQSATEQDQQRPAPAPAPAPEAAPTPEPAPDAQVPAPAAAPEPSPAPDVAPAAPPAPGQIEAPPAAPGQIHVSPNPHVHVQVPPMPPMPDINGAPIEVMGNKYYFYRDSPGFGGGNPWALVPAEGEPQPEHISSDDRAEIDQARKNAHAPFLWFKHDGKSYIVDDPSVVAQVESMEKPIEDLRSQMRALRTQQHALGEQLRQQMREQRQTSIPKPDLSKQMADLNAAVDSMKSSQGDTVTREQLRKLQEQIGQLQGQIARAESGFYRQNGQWGAAMGEFGRQMGKLGGEQGRLAGEMARMSVANRGKIDAIISQSLKDGKAKAAK
jgi:beta-lactamase regulating signal transducer with metallopeptidase domain/chaperonin cofactor prefoldin